MNPDSNPVGGYSRRQALKLGGLTVSMAAIFAACGEDRMGDTAAGRVGYAPPVTDPPDYAVDDAVLLRTASSLEYTAIAVYDAILSANIVDADTATLFQRLIDDHQMVADEMDKQTEAVGGVAWTCTNPWYMDRLVNPLIDTVTMSDNPERDARNTAVAVEDITAASNQSMTTQLEAPAASMATLEAATLESRHAAAVVASFRGADGYVSPTIRGGEDPADDDGVPLMFSITSRFGSTGQIALVVGKPNELGVRQTFVLQTPSLNSYIYNELEPTC